MEVTEEHGMLKEVLKLFLEKWNWLRACDCLGVAAKTLRTSERHSGTFILLILFILVV